MEGDMTTPVSPGISENGYHPDGGESAPARQQWRDGFQERDFNQAGSGTQWEDWSQVMRAALDPPLGCLEEVLRRTPIDDPLDQAEASGLYRLMVEQISAPCPSTTWSSEASRWRRRQSGPSWRRGVALGRMNR